MREALERCLADLETGSAGFAFASGSAATATEPECLDQGSHLIATDDLYGGTFRLFERVRKHSAGLEVSLVDMSDPRRVEAAIRPQTRLIWVETPTNPSLKLVDLSAIAEIGRRRGVWTAADNTFASPWVQRPLDHGLGVVVHPTTKYLNGHSDVIGGVASVGNDHELSDRLRFLQNAVGGRGGLRQLSRIARRQNAGAAYGKALCQCACDRRTARPSSVGPLCHLPGIATRSTSSPGAR
jgi:cystathionine gamma-lyase